MRVADTRTECIRRNDRPPNWHSSAKRWIQINLDEDDPLSPDVEEWLEIWQDAQADSLVVSAAGAAAYYPTTVPGHRRASFLADRDPFGELAAAARSLGMRVIARIESTFASRGLVTAHPEWFQREADGQLRTSTSMMRADGISSPVATCGADAPPDNLFVPCVTGDYFRRFIPEVMTELVRMYDVDGFMANGPWSPSAVCRCARCARLWAVRGHRDLPQRPDVGDPEWCDYLDFVQETATAVQHDWQHHLKALRPDLTLVACSSGVEGSAPAHRFPSNVDIVESGSRGCVVAGTPNASGSSRTAQSPARTSQNIRGRGAERRRAHHGARPGAGDRRPSVDERCQRRHP